MPFDAPIHTNEANLPRVLGAGLPVLLVFWQHHCAPCDQLAPTLDRLARNYAGRALIVKVDASQETGLMRRYQVSQLPSLLFFRDGRLLATASGAAGERELVAWLDYLTGGGAQPPVPSGPSMRIQGAPGGYPPRAAPKQPRGGGSQTFPRHTAGAGTGRPVVLTDATFDQTIHGTSLPVLVDFWAVWCGPCKMIEPAVADLAREFAGQAVVGRLNVDENPHIAARYGIMSIPTLLIFRNGQVVDRIVGAQPAQVLRQRLAQQVR